MATAIGFVMLAIYIFLPFCFLRGSIKILIKYFRDQKRDYEVVNGSVAEIEKQVHKKAKGGWKISYYIVYRFTYGGKSYRRYGYRLPMRIGSALKPAPRTKLAAGDPIQIRVYLPVQDKLECRIEEPFYFWKSRLWRHILSGLVGLLFVGYGLYCAWLQLTCIL